MQSTSKLEFYIGEINIFAKHSMNQYEATGVCTPRQSEINGGLLGAVPQDERHSHSYILSAPNIKSITKKAMVTHSWTSVKSKVLRYAFAEFFQEFDIDKYGEIDKEDAEGRERVFTSCVWAKFRKYETIVKSEIAKIKALFEKRAAHLEKQALKSKRNGLSRSAYRAQRGARKAQAKLRAAHHAVRLANFQSQLMTRKLHLDQFKLLLDANLPIQTSQQMYHFYYNQLLRKNSKKANPGIHATPAIPEPDASRVTNPILSAKTCKVKPTSVDETLAALESSSAAQTSNVNANKANEALNASIKLGKQARAQYEQSKAMLKYASSAIHANDGITSNVNRDTGSDILYAPPDSRPNALKDAIHSKVSSLATSDAGAALDAAKVRDEDLIAQLERVSHLYEMNLLNSSEFSLAKSRILN